MDKFLRDLQSLHWLLSVVVVSLIVNLLSSYLVRCIDWIAPRLFLSWIGISKKRQERFEAQIEHYLAEPTGEISLKLDEISNTLRAFLFVVFGIFLAILAEETPPSLLAKLFGFGSLVGIVTVLSYAWEARKAINILEEVKRRKGAQ